MKVLVTGAAGFIGAALAGRLLDCGHEVLGLDNLNEYYDPKLKRDRLDRLLPQAGFRFELVDIANPLSTFGSFERFFPDAVVNLAAQVGLHYSMVNLLAYVDSNLNGFLNILECCRQLRVKHLVYASSSSVYGASPLPFSPLRSVDHPLSLYAAAKRSNELMAHSYSHLYSIPTTGLRFFSVYGPWGRPDMVLSRFAKKLLADEPLDFFNRGNHRRDFTYVDDVVETLFRVLERPATPDPIWDGKDLSASPAPYRIYNVGSQVLTSLTEVTQLLEESLRKKATIQCLPAQLCDSLETQADTRTLIRDFGNLPMTPLRDGIRKFAAWFLAYYA